VHSALDTRAYTPALIGIARNPTSSGLTRHELSWEPTHLGLIADLDEGHYFQQLARTRTSDHDYWRDQSTALGGGHTPECAGLAWDGKHPDRRSVLA
jgi:hypothetical protein